MPKFRFGPFPKVLLGALCVSFGFSCGHDYTLIVPEFVSDAKGAFG